jgi:hypothetical protein
MLQARVVGSRQRENGGQRAERPRRHHEAEVVHDVAALDEAPVRHTSVPPTGIRMASDRFRRAPE